MKTIREIRAERLYNSLNNEVNTILNHLNATQESYLNNEISAKRAKKQYYKLMKRANILNNRYTNVENITDIEKPQVYEYDIYIGVL